MEKGTEAFLDTVTILDPGRRSGATRGVWEEGPKLNQRRCGACVDEGVWGCGVAEPSSRGRQSVVRRWPPMA